MFTSEATFTEKFQTGDFLSTIIRTYFICIIIDCLVELIKSFCNIFVNSLLIIGFMVIYY
jgi:hypothetical protein